MINQLILFFIIIFVLLTDRYFTKEIYQLKNTNVLIGEFSKSKNINSFKLILKKYLFQIISLLIIIAFKLTFNETINYYSSIYFKINFDELLILVVLVFFYTFFAIKTLSYTLLKRKLIAREFLYFFFNIIVVFSILFLSENNQEKWKDALSDSIGVMSSNFFENEEVQLSGSILLNGVPTVEVDTYKITNSFNDEVLTKLKSVGFKISRKTQNLKRGAGFPFRFLEVYESFCFEKSGKWVPGEGGKNVWKNRYVYETEDTIMFCNIFLLNIDLMYNNRIPRERGAFIGVGQYDNTIISGINLSGVSNYSFDESFYHPDLLYYDNSFFKDINLFAEGNLGFLVFWSGNNRFSSIILLVFIFGYIYRFTLSGTIWSIKELI